MGPGGTYWDLARDPARPGETTPETAGNGEQNMVRGRRENRDKRVAVGLGGT